GGPGGGSQEAGSKGWKGKPAVVLDEECQNLKKKLADKKKECEKLAASMGEGNRAHQKSKNQWKLKEAELRSALEQAQDRFVQLQRSSSAEQSAQLRSVMTHNQRLLQEQQNRLDLLGQGTASKRPSSAMTLSRRTASRRFEESQQQAMEFGRLAELKNLEQQYEHFLTEQVAEAERLSAHFSKYREYKGKQVQELEQELVTLYRIVESSPEVNKHESRR
ncbi:unnamed protein product, partial [Chrysoparadoxa australica]